MGHASRSLGEAIPLHRVAILSPFARFLGDVGAGVQSGFQRAGLPFGALENLNNYVPSKKFYSFLRDMAFREGIEELGFHVGRRFGADNVDPHVTERLRQSPSLFLGLHDSLELANKSVTNSQMGILVPSKGRYAFFYHRPSCDVADPAIRQIGWFGIMTLIGMIRVFTGPRWQPAEIGLMTRCGPCPLIREQLGGTRLRLSQTCSYVRVDKTQLSLPPHIAGAIGMAAPLHSIDCVSGNFIGSLKQVLHTYIEEPDLSIEVAAELCGTSKRSLQRKLREMGSSYSRVLDQVRFDVASRMLQEPDVTVGYVSHRLGYSDPTHFARAFKRVAGVNPRGYRAAHIH